MSAEPPSDGAISIRVSSRPPKPKKFPDDFRGERVVYFGEDGRPEPTAKRQAEPAVEQPLPKRRGRPPKKIQGDTENAHGSSPDHQSSRSSTPRVPPTKKSFSENSSTPYQPSTTAAIVNSPLVKELGNAREDLGTADTRPQDPSSVPPRSTRSGLEDYQSPEDNESNAQALPANTQPLARAATPLEPVRQEDDASIAVTMPTSGLPLYKTPQDRQANEPQTQDAGTSYYRAATVEGVMQGPGTPEPLIASIELVDTQPHGFRGIDAANQCEHQRPQDEVVQLGMRLKEFYTLLDSQSQSNADTANQSEKLDKEERELKALEEQVSRKAEEVALHRSMLHEMREALEKQDAEIARETKKLLRRD
ncbi:hypothetical protein LTR09_011673 [Extremus antarcticus]|uniref:Uncharacterized protein n=1 Tax=Extremus antarcticus TaxID=702011 RepID=A0AAJ0G4C2_9PEZI|nr:hypothetical protein LTR09_011673 [Extremus antarcticus]